MTLVGRRSHADLPESWRVKRRTPLADIMKLMKSCLGLLSCAAWLSSILAATVSLGAERLDRGTVAERLDEHSVFLSWRLLAADAPETAFDVYRSDPSQGRFTKINAQPIVEGCNYLDRQAPERECDYRVMPVKPANDAGATRSAHAGPAGATINYVRIPLAGSYRAQKVGIADLDGDAVYEYVVKQPDFNTDPYQQPGYWKKSEDTYKIEAYRSDGRLMWRYDMGWAIEEGIWYSPIVVYDLDGDGKAEVMTKAGEGDPREPDGKVTSGPEYLVVLDGVTGKLKKKLPWPTRDGLDEYNYYSRNLLGIAYLDGVHPHLIVQRGTYRLIKLQALRPDLTLQWSWEASGKFTTYRGQGMHGMHAADVDEDGRDEVVLGSAVIDDNGQPLWTIRLGHPDICYVADVDPARPGLEIFYGIEPGKQSNTVCLVEARTGKRIWGSSEITVHVHGQGMVGDIIPEESGMECYAGEAKGGSNYWLYAASGKRLSNQSLGELSPKAVFWLEGLTKAYVLDNKIFKWPREQVGRIEGRVVAIADCLGDWREEIITSLPGEIRIYSTTIPTPIRRPCLMQDRLYRTDVAMQTMGYFYPPQLSGKTPVP
jgi:rhamnogalacturonan endolyase